MSLANARLAAEKGTPLVIGTTGFTPEQLQEKHALQASVYADVLHKAGFERVTLMFVRVEVDDPADPGEPQVVTYAL